MIITRTWRRQWRGPSDTSGFWALVGERGRTYATVEPDGQRFRAQARGRRRRDLGTFDDLPSAQAVARRATDPGAARSA